MIRIFAVITLLAIASCGKKDKDSPNNIGPVVKDPPLQLANEGNYRSVLTPINTLINDKEAYGTSIINIEEDVFSVQLHLTGIPKSQKYFQSIHEDDECPTELNDINSDSIIDLQEGMTALGKVLIPLDGDIRTQISGNDYFTRSNNVGNYSYEEDSPLGNLLDDLHEADEDLHDDIIKLSAEDFLNLEKRTLVISVVERRNEMTGSINSIEDQRAEAFIPIACGKIVRIKNEEPIPTDL